MSTEEKLPKSSYICIQAFMINDLHLKGIEKEVYALIYGFSQDGKSEFSGSISYIQKWTGTSKPTVRKALNYLEEKQLIIKTRKSTGPTSCNHYVANLKLLQKQKTGTHNEDKSHQTKPQTSVVIGKNTYPVNNFTSKENYPSGKNSLPVPSKNSLPNNKEDKYINNPNPKIPSLDDVISFSETFGDGLYVDPGWFYKYNSDRQWKDNACKPISSWKALFSNWNSIKAQQVQKEEQTKTEAKERVQRIKTAMAKEQQQRDAERANEVAAKTNLSCPKCGRTFPDINLRFVDINTMACDVCKTTWSTINEQTDNSQAKAVV